MRPRDLGTVRLFRFDPATDSEPRYEEYQAPYRGYTVLNVLRSIAENLDGSFSFRWACGKGFCRCCVLCVNDRPLMSCKAMASPYMKISPHPKFRVIKDLIVDLDKPLFR